MRLLILHQAFVFGGAERTTSNLITHLDRRVVSHLTLAAPAALRAHLPDRVDDFIETATLIRGGWFGQDPADLELDVAATARLLDQARPDLALGMMHYGAALVTFAAPRAEQPPRVVGSFRGPIFEYLRRYEPGAARQRDLRRLIGATARQADLILVPSRGTARDTLWRFGGWPWRVRVIPNGIDGDAVRAAAAEPFLGLSALPPDLPLLCVAARLSIEKDLRHLIDAVRLLQDRHPCALVVVGDGPERADLERRVAASGLAGRVFFVGHRVNVYPYMRRADIYVHTCQFEGFGYTMLEAMACGTPVVATDCPHGPREVLDGGRCGVLVRPGDSRALAAGIAGLLADPRRRERLRQRGLERAESLSARRMAERYLRAFESVLRRPARRPRRGTPRR